MQLNFGGFEQLEAGSSSGESQNQTTTSRKATKQSLNFETFDQLNNLQLLVVKQTVYNPLVHISLAVRKSA